jgi:ankyrin repeat protein
MENSIKKEIIDKTNNNGKNEDKKKNEKENQTGKRDKEKKETLSFFKRKELERQKNMEQFQKELTNKNFRIMVDKAEHIIVQKKLGKRYTLFKTILNYLESNNITLYELLTNNPFQSKPYELTNSYEFLAAVKFKNYAHVTEALNSSKKFLFSFDYFGQTAYHWAAKLNDIKMLKILLDFGLYHNQKDFKGRTPLYLAAYYNQKEVCIFLLNNNGNIFLKDKKDLSPADVAGSHELKYYLYEYMTQPFSNPIYKARIKNFLKDREERIKKKREKEFFERKEKLEKERLQKLLKEEEEKKDKKNKEKEKKNIVNKEDK